MLSIGAMAAGQATYYLELAREDYYLEGGEPPGRWFGRGAEALRLAGAVEKKELHRLFDGFSPRGKPLIQNAGDLRHQPGWDLTFSAPKSVSVLWSQADQATRKEIQQAHDAAVKAALSYLEETAAFSRIGKGGHGRVPAGLVVALFDHGTSRALDPQFHTHALLVNVTVRADGTTGTLLSKPIYQHKMATGAIYRAEFAVELERRLGLEIERDKTSFKLSRVPQGIVDFFSKRRAAIEERLSSSGVETAAAAAFATLATREAKKVVPPRQELFADWQKQGEARGFTAQHIESLLSRAPRRDQAKEFSQAFDEAVKFLSQTESHFSARDVLRRTAEAAQGRGLTAANIRSGVQRELESSSRFIRLTQGLNARYATAEMFALEKRLFEVAGELRKDQSHGVSRKTLEAVLARYAAPRSGVREELKHHAAQIVRAARGQKTSTIDREQMKRDAAATLSKEQAAAVRYVTEAGGGSVRFVSGMAGTGKTFMLKAAREAWERDGYKVIGVALSAKAAKGLQHGSGIESITLRGLEVRLEGPALAYSLKHHARQLVRAAQGKKTYRLKPLAIDKKTVIVIDEAGMLGTRQFANLLEAVRKGGGIVVSVGDPKQLQAIDAGGPFGALLKRHPHVELKEITRQKDSRDIEAVYDFAHGRASKALKGLAERRLVTVAENRTQAIERLVTDWFERERSRPETSLIFCGTKAEALEINRRCRAKRLDAGDIDAKKSVRTAEGTLHEGDRVLFTKNSRVLGVSNGETGTIIAVWPATAVVSVQIDGGARVAVPLRDYQDIRLGYAVTTHKGQGTTVENAYLLAGGAMQDREISYVQASRAKHEARIYTDRSEAGPELSQLAKQMSNSRAKELAHDVLVQTHAARQREPSLAHGR